MQNPRHRAPQLVALLAPLLLLALTVGCPSSSPATSDGDAGAGVGAEDGGQIDAGLSDATDGGHSTPADGGADGPEDAGHAGSTDAGSAADGGAEPDGGAHDAGLDVDAGVSAFTPPPFPSYSEGACPQLASASTKDASYNVGFSSGGESRSFRLLVPESYDGSEPLPLVVGFHWLNASSSSFVDNGEMETAISQFNFIALLPDGLEDGDGDKKYQFDWPFAETWGVEKELTFLNDMLACVDEQFAIDHEQVHAMGVSAGALWATYLSTMEISNRFASFVILSGGLGDVGPWEMQFAPQPRKFPAVVLWGGSSDWLIVNFDTASRDYRDALLGDDHFLVTCEHDEGHAMPPIEPPPNGGTIFSMFWEFMRDHPYGVPPSTSPYESTGLPASFQSWCQIAQ